MKIVSFNINGLRARPHQLQALIDKHQPDVIGLQETKVADEQFPEEDIRQLGYHVHYHGQKGHYGVALLSREAPLELHKGFPGDAEDAQRRFIYGTFADKQGNPVTVMNGYFPQGESRDHPTKFPGKQRFYADLQQLLVERFDPAQALVVMGDINISPEDCDIGIGEPNRLRWLKTGKCSFLPEERAWMTQLLADGVVDVYRRLQPDTTEACYTWWSNRGQAYAKNVGWRLDYHLATPAIAETARTEAIYKGEKFSDHAPITVEYELTL